MYRMEKHKLSHRVAFLLAFTVASMAVGAWLFAPPLWDEHRRWQLAGFGIGILSWGVVLSVLLSAISRQLEWVVKDAWSVLGVVFLAIILIIILLYTSVRGRADAGGDWPD